MKTIAVDDLGMKADAAFLVAARKVIEEARRAGDGILTWRDGRVTEISCEEAERLLEQAEQGESKADFTNALRRRAETAAAPD